MAVARPRRADYRYPVAITTRWMDNDVYGHVNNVTYYSYFDTAANQFLIGEGGLDVHGGDVIGLVVESACQYHAPIAYPTPLTAMVRVDRLGGRAVNDSSAWHSTSSPAAATTLAGKVAVTRGSITASVGRSRGDATPVFTWCARRSKIAMPVTSLPVPAVVGHATWTGSAAVSGWPSPHGAAT